MPSETFFRLPEEKRHRLMDAAWEEFTRVRFSDVSINKIILKARIPRGSFYQYFEHKDDLFFYLVRPLQLHFFELARQEVEKARGDLFSSPLRIFDRFFSAEESLSQDLSRCLQIVKRNPDSEFHSLFCSPDSPMGEIAHLVDVTPLRRQDPEFLREVFRLFVVILASAIIDALNDPEGQQAVRDRLALQTRILMEGCALSTIPHPQGGTV